MSRRFLFLAASLYLGAALAPSLSIVMAQSQVASNGRAKTNKRQAAGNAGGSQQQQQNEGQRIFEQNCSRCHNAPEGFSPNISGTIVRHMRVRASLSKHDEEELLRFFNP